MKSYSLLVFSLLAVVLAAGCIGQVETGTGGIVIKALADPSSILTTEPTALFVDVENKDNSQFIKVFVEAFDTGPFDAVRSPSVQPQQGFLPVPGSFAVEFGQTNFDVAVTRSCTSSSQCFDEEYGGCGICDVPLGSSSAVGTCLSASSIRAPGQQCTKPCECGPGSVCKRDADGVSRCAFGTSTCSSGLILNSCGTPPTFCSPYGESKQACGGLDGIPDSVYAPSGGRDDCGCPGGTVCRGDGTCGLPSQCFTTIYGLKPSEIRTLECSLALKNPSSIIQDTTAGIQLRTVFRKRLHLDDVVQFLSREEYRRQETLGQLQRKSQLLGGGDQNVQLSVSYNKEPPFIAGEKALLRISIKSIGSGTVYTLNPSDILIGQPSDKINCNIATPLRSDRGQFTPITCEINVGEIESIENYPFTINVYYDYETRSSLPISIKKV